MRESISTKTYPVLWHSDFKTKEYLTI